MMSKSDEARAGLLDIVLQRHEEGTLKWKTRELNASYQSEAAGFTFHIDRKAVAGTNLYILWVFKKGEVFARIDANKLKEKPQDSRFQSYALLVRYIFEDVQETETAARLTEVISRLNHTDNAS